MNKTDFYDCEYIDKYMRFYTYQEFCDNRFIIKARYKEMVQNGKRFYKWYVYANIWLNETLKNAIWDYLNDYDDGRNLMLYRRRFVHK